MDYFASVRAFLWAAELQSFSKAASRMSLRTSTISRYITDLEADLGIALFNRSTRGLVLTEGGRVFRQHASIAVNALEEARHLTSNLNDAPQGLLRVTTPESFGRTHIVRHLPAFLQRHPQIEVECLLTDEVINMIELGMDLAIRIGILPDSQLMARHLAPHTRIFCASPDYLREFGEPQTPEALRQHTVLKPGSPSDESAFLYDRGSRAKWALSDLSHGRVNTNDLDATLQLAIAGCGIALLPTWALTPHLESGALHALFSNQEVRNGEAPAGIWAVYPPKRIVSSKVRAFVDFYAELFSGGGYWDASW